jgi:hypothetical protein
MPNTKRKLKTEKTQLPFATADKIAGGIRKAMHEPYGNPGDETMPARLLLAVSDWLKSPDPKAYSFSLLLTFFCRKFSLDPILKTAAMIAFLYISLHCI